jgi:hypothetical protein
MKDLNGIEFEDGHDVFFTHSYGNIKQGVVVGFSPKRIRIEYSQNIGNRLYTYVSLFPPERVAVK